LQVSSIEQHYTERDRTIEQQSTTRSGFTGKQVTLIILVVIVATLSITFLAVRLYIFPADFAPVTLSAQEEQQLDHKLRRLGWQRETPSDNANQSIRLEPEAYSESDSDREVTFSEKELNALVSSNSDYARRVAIDLADNLASAKILIPIPQDFPVMAGRILRVNAGLDIRLTEARQPAIALKGVSIMGVPVPNAWLGNLKNVDLVGEFGDRGFWKAFADGVEDLKIRDGELYIKLRE
jgi:arginine N-succinyltransferase